MSDVPTPRLSDSNGAWLRTTLVLFGRGIIYSLAFWAVYRAVYLVYPSKPSNEDEKWQARQSNQLDAYDEQMKRGVEMAAESQRQQARMDAILSKQEEHSRRFEAVLERWEKQVGIRK